ncbi:PD-(D/E)XK motif protein [Curtobacterium sp. MCBD17_026]|uniref:PD-(D/E)XK motif protein n=1 Tax=Curtobacterium sp. MCBD17_026 TaxID=2175621 RepID=UPI0015E88632|nr:PD-(D/E)XK motif protein [Curtobacterium sp. MCBD17_026]WIB69581.1 PD-(D/E)XK motif protein [Curtobacterium sp. MCBD17_026]
MSQFLGALSGSVEDGWGFEEFLAFARRFADLFRDTPDPSDEVIKGLWGELRFVSETEDPQALLRGWHASPYSVLDFELPAVAFEVKSTESESLRFHFRDQQLKVRREDGWVVVVSLYRSESGVSILDLLARLSVRLSPTDYQQALSKSVDVLGSALLGVGHIKFDLRPFGIQLTRMESLPVIGSIPSSVSNVSFIQDLNGLDESGWRGLDTVPALLR